MGVADWPRWRALVALGAKTTRQSLAHLLGGLATAFLALVALVCLAAVAVASLAGVGLLLAPTALRAVRAVADLERARLSRWGPAIALPDPVPTGLRAALADHAVRRDLAWLTRHATLGLLISLVGLTVPLAAVRDGTFPLWWWLLPPAGATPAVSLWTVHDWPGAFRVCLLGPAWAALTVGVGPALARCQARPGRRLLAPPPDVDLSLRISQLTATRAAALDAHATELRRIERSLHDGTQNRLVAVTVLVGAARRALARDSATAEVALERAQQAAESALAELRTVVRGILPPVLADRGLAAALAGLVAECAVPCRIDVEMPGRCPAAVEATVYFVVAEALTNISKHSGAHHAEVTVRRSGDRLRVRVDDDGCGGAHERGGSGLTGIRRRIEALDGTLTLSSPPGGPTALEAVLPCGS